MKEGLKVSLDTESQPMEIYTPDQNLKTIYSSISILHYWIQRRFQVELENAKKEEMGAIDKNK